MKINKISITKIKLKDTVIYVLVFGLIIYLGYQDLRTATDDEFLDRFSTFIGTVSIILFGVVGLFEFAYDNGLTLLVPDSFINYKEKRAKKQMKAYIESYLKEELHIISQYNNERISFFLAQLGLTQHDFELIKSEIILIKMMPLKNTQDAQEKIKKILLSNTNIITKQDEQTSNRLVYKKVRYFINFTDIMYIREYSEELEDSFIIFLKEELETELSNIDKIVIPYNSNRMLGFGIGEKLGKAIVNVTKTPYIFEDQCWEGHLNDSLPNHGIIVHDILVSGEQILESINKIGNKCEIKHVFCLIDRVDNKGKEKLEDKGLIVHSLLTLSDDDVEKLLDEELNE